MDKLFEKCKAQGVTLPKELEQIITQSKNVSIFNTVDELAEAATSGKENNEFHVEYEIAEKGFYREATVHRVQNGISVNYEDVYMRRRDPETMVIADKLPTDKVRFADRFGYEFDSLREETFEWLKGQELGMFFFFAGRKGIGVGGVAIVPANAAFFAMGLSMLQEMVSIDDLPKGFDVNSVIYVAPPFRHTHFDGKQVVVHNRLDGLHELFSYNLYPGPSAKKGLYSVLLSQGEKEGWITAHCSTVQVVSPYDNTTTFMHEGASGGGKSEMLQHIVREEDGRILIGENLETGEKRFINIPRFCSFNPVTDDMALCHPSIQKKNGRLRVLDAENAWFIRTDSINEYGDDPFLEKVTINPGRPLLFLNINTVPGSTALVWDHIEDAPGKKCPNPRVVLPREIVKGVKDKAVSVDVRSFGVRTPPFASDSPSYGIMGMFHVLPPALAWLWRLVSPRGHANPSIVSTGGMESEGVGSYWPFAAGEMVHHANLLLEQIVNTPKVKYVLVPNQHIGAWKVGFKPQLLMREYLTRRGNAHLREDQYQPARSALLGYEMNYLTIEGAKIPSRFLKTYRQPEVGEAGYDEGHRQLSDFFKREVQKFNKPGLSSLGKKIIEACLNDATVEEYAELIQIKHPY